MLDSSAFLADPELVQALVKHSLQVSFGGEYAFFRQGDHPVGLYIVEQGEVTLSMAPPSGGKLFSVTVSAGSVLGLPGLVANEPYTLTAVAQTGAQLRFVTRSEFLLLMENNPPLALKILGILAAEVRSARETILELMPEQTRRTG
jgi:CRP-like cAMP-binding protein